MARKARDIVLRAAIARNIREYIDMEGCSTREFAKKFGISHSTLAQYINGLRTPPVEFLVNFAEYYHSTVDDLTR
jgi:transcriptional regulator with XRE-family HTH domain